MFRRLFDNLLGKKSSPLQASVPGMGVGSVDLFDTDIPRYPPFAAGLPAAPVDKIIQTQNELIGRIQSTLGFRDEDFARYVLPVINQFARFVHLLPASESHHHRGAGGLFRHGLEVAFWAAQASENMIFTMEGSPQDRRNNTPRWRLACCFAGLLHDVGKPLHDVSVTDQRGETRWNPYAESLIEWAERNEVSHYFLRWRDKRHKRHEQFSLLTIERIIAPEVWQYLSDPGPEMIEAMMEAVAGININQPVTKLTLKADQESVSRDIRNNRLNVDEYAYGVPVERYVFDAIRRLINTGRWKVNEAGAKVWVLQQGVFVTWKQIGELFELIDQDKTPGIPRDTDTLADILIERGYALARTVSEHGEEATYRYWEVSPEILATGNISAPASLEILMLRFESPELLFTSEPPAPVNGKVTGLDDKEYEFESLDDNGSGDTSTEAEAYSAPDVDVPLIRAADPLQESEISEEPGSGKTPANTVSVEQSKGKKKPLIAELSNENKSHGMSFSSTQQATDPLSTDSALLDQIGLDSGLSILAGLMGDDAGINGADEQGRKPVVSSGDAVVKKETAPARSNRITTGKTIAAQSQPEEETAPDPKTESLAQLNHVLSEYKEAYPLLEKSLMAVVNRETLMGENICFLQNRLAILHPKGLESMGDMQVVMAALSNSGALEADPAFPGKKVQIINGIKAVVLTRDISASFKSVLDTAEDFCEAEAMIAPDAQTKPNQVASGAKRSEQKPMQGNSGSTPARKTSAKTEPENIPASQKKEVSSNRQVNNREPQSAISEIVALKKGKKKDQAVSGQQDPTAIQALDMLKTMIADRKGRWLVGPVKEEDGTLITSALALEKIAEEYLSISSGKLKFTLKAKCPVGRRLTIEENHLVLEPLKTNED